MTIRINGKNAVLKKDISFEYVAENRLFSGSDSYTLSITFPLKNCRKNIDIFGNINRMDVAAGKLIFDCEIRDRNFCKSGLLVITGISESEVTTQFLEGRSEQNFNKTFDKVYINELPLGTPPTTSTKYLTPAQAWQPDHTSPECVALPWVNDYSGNIQNKADFIPAQYDSQGHLIQNEYYQWTPEETSGLSWQPYLLYIAKMICKAVGYSSDFSQWEKSEQHKYLLICNTLPYAWQMPDFAYAMPRWTVDEFFEKLEYFLDGEFDINHRDKSVSFRFAKNILDGKTNVRLDNVIDEHSSEVAVEDINCDYSGLKNLSYKDCDHEMWKYYACDWFIEGWKNRVVRYRTLANLIKDNKGYASWSGEHHRYSNIDKLLYAEDCNAYFIIRAVSRQLQVVVEPVVKMYYLYRCRLQPVNLFGARIVDDSDDADSIECEFVPAWIDETDDKYGQSLFLSFSAYDEDNSSPTENDDDMHAFMQTITDSSLTAGEKEKKSEYYDRIYVGFWDGSQNTHGKLPYPWVHDIEISDDWESFSFLRFSLRLNTATKNQKIIPEIEPSVKYTFKFIADSIPDVRSIFNIRGKRYLCEKITASFTENGMSQLLKGEFYPLKE